MAALNFSREPDVAKIDLLILEQRIKYPYCLFICRPNEFVCEFRFKSAGDIRTWVYNNYKISTENSLDDNLPKIIWVAEMLINS